MSPYEIRKTGIGTYAKRYGRLAELAAAGAACAVAVGLPGAATLCGAFSA
jgi:hypothetical protein